MIDTYVEIGKTRTFAGALDWPGWCRAGRDPDAALQALLEYAPRYAAVLRGTRLGFEAPSDASAFTVVERLEGDASTDFGAPGAVPRADSPTVADADLRRLEAVLRACWRVFDAAAQAAANKPLRSGPRGGGRDVDKIVQHVLEAEGGYLNRLAWKLEPGDERERLARTRNAIVDALDAHRETPPPGPRGGTRWPPRYFVRRVAWHALDHAWEIEDRLS